MAYTIDILIIGGGMITNDLILPSVYQLRRDGLVGDVSVCALNSAPLARLSENGAIREAFPGSTFTPCPALEEPGDRMFPDLYKEVLDRMKPRQGVIVALPDQFHYTVVKDALLRNQHVLCVKPLVLKYVEALEIEHLAYERGLFVGVEYHKRFDRRALFARREYRRGRFGEFVIGEAQMIEPYYYRFSNFQNWFTADKTDPFVYVGCHYVDLVCFITGLKPSAVSVEGIRRKFPNGNEAFMWSLGRVRFENGALLSVTNGLGYPDNAAGANDQGLKMYCEGEGKTGLMFHDDHYRGVAYSYVGEVAAEASHYNYINPDFFRLVPWEGEGLKPVGYGVDSVAASIGAMRRIEEETASASGNDACVKHRSIIREIDRRGLIATPANSAVNELVHEAARMSILAEGMTVEIVYDNMPHVRVRK